MASEMEKIEGIGLVQFLNKDKQRDCLMILINVSVVLNTGPLFSKTL